MTYLSYSLNHPAAHMQEIHMSVFWESALSTINLYELTGSNQAVCNINIPSPVVIAQLALKRTEYYALIQTELSLTDS